MRHLTFGFYKMLACYRVATQLVDSGVVLSSMKSTIIIIIITNNNNDDNRDL
jgi:1,4-dihydroxy-2-naphthoate octaprenyltransferase